MRTSRIRLSLSCILWKVVSRYWEGAFAPSPFQSTQNRSKKKNPLKKQAAQYEMAVKRNNDLPH